MSGDTVMEPSTIPTEAEMSTVRSIMERAISGIVSLSQLQVDFDNLKTQVRELSESLERQRNRNSYLDAELSEVRAARDGYKVERDKAVADNDSLVSKNEVQAGELRTLAESNARLVDRLNQANRDRDDAELKAMELEDKLKVAEDKLSEIRDMARSTFGLVEPAPVQAPQVETTNVVEIPSSMKDATIPYQPEETTQAPAPASYPRSNW
jgi:chromosome segregation ATPase